MTSKEAKCSISAEGGASYNGSEQHADRPAVVVSNNKNNENSNVVEVVYMTTQPKTDLPTHVTIRSTGRISTVLCEQVYSVSTERVGTYIGECTDKEMENIDIALMISLQLDGNMKTSKKYNETIKEQQEEIDSLKKEIEMLQQEHGSTVRRCNSISMLKSRKRQQLQRVHLTFSRNTTIFRRHSRESTQRTLSMR